MISQNTEVTKLEALIAAFDNDRNYFGTIKYSEKERMDKRSEFISDFPPEKLSNLQLNRYVVGKINMTNGEADKTTFCYRLEFGIPGFGNIGGTPSSKYGIYCDKKTQEYKYDNQRYKSPEEAFREIRIELDTITKAGKQLIVDQDWKKLANVMERKYNIMRHVRSKILAVYFPDYFLSIHANKQAKEILESVFEVPPSEIDESLFLKQAMLLKFKNSHPSMKKWSIFDFSRFIWLANADRKTNINNTQKNNISLWVVRAGSNGEGENAALNHHVVTIGFGNLEGLAEIKDRKQFDQKYAELNPNDNEKSNAQRRAQVWSFINDIKRGDIIALPLKTSESKFVAIGQIEGEFQDKHAESGLLHTRQVNWLKKDLLVSKLDEEMRSQLIRRPTVYSIEDGKMLNQIVKILKDEGLTIADSAKVAEFETVIEGSEDIVKSKITIEDVSRETLIPLDRMKEIEVLLREKKQVIFYGPPGTSKTYVARKFAEYFAQGRENVEIVQFHQSYSYEDFIEGIRPKISPSGDTTGFSKQRGLFKNLSEKCSKHPDKKFVLIIDEINRGNISKIFGELIYLLEYRDEAISLTYSPEEKFSIPSNLFIIGTMNSADRSIAFVDYALRRRFYFIDFYSASNGILENWFKENNVEKEITSNILKMLSQINEQITQQLGKEYQIGYSYFMLRKLDREKVNRIISYAITPLLEQYFFGRGQKLEELKHICSSIFLQPSSEVNSSNT